MRASLLAALVLVMCPATVSADVVSPEPDRCPNGGRPSTCHGGPHCGLLTCTADTDCTSGAVCREVRVCVGTINCAGGLPPDADPSEFDVDTHEGLCGGGSCSTGTCETRMLCVDPDRPPVGGDGCGCGAAGADLAGGLGALGAAAGVALLLVRRRRRGRP